MSKVYFADMHATFDENLQQKLVRLMRSAGINSINFKKQFTAIKMHFGEPGNLSYLRHNYAKTVADVVKSLGGRPFLTDCNTLYAGRRKDALEHLDASYENGFSPFGTGCQVIIGDGLKGNDFVEVPINCKYVKSAKIGRAVMDADIIISLTHFKGHEGTGIGGAIKNVGMGCGSRAGKMEMHNNGKPQVDTDLCASCGKCRKICAHDAICFVNKKANIDHSKCVNCGMCMGICVHDAIYPSNGSSCEALSEKMAEYAYAVLKDRPHFHISLIVDVSPKCDCHGDNDVPIVPDIGMIASFDPVALDHACADLVNEQLPQKGSVLFGVEKGTDYFTAVHPVTDWQVTLRHAEEIGLGSYDYELVKI